jgi:micrococcal nuclease
MTAVHDGTRFYRAVDVGVIDGDTIDVDVDLGFYVTTRARLRFAGIDCPELNTAAGKAARDATAGWLHDTRMIIISQWPLLIETRSKQDIYNRWIAVIRPNTGPDAAAGASLNDWLVTGGHAVRSEYR